jgi:rhodanese-related sulfurtransferase
MKPEPANPPEAAPAPSAQLWLQAACIFAAAVAFGVVYNGASPLGVRPPQPPAVGTAAAAPGAVPASPPPARRGYSNQTLSMTLEAPPGVVMPPPPNNQAAVLAAPPPPLPSLTWPQVQALMASQKVVVVDARTKAAFDLGHIPGAVLLPPNASVRDLQSFAALYPKDTPLVVYCSSTSCHTSQNMAQQLVTVAGFKNVSHMPGGFAEYTLAQAAAPPVKP